MAKDDNIFWSTIFIVKKICQDGAKKKSVRIGRTCLPLIFMFLIFLIATKIMNCIKNKIPVILSPEKGYLHQKFQR